VAVTVQQITADILLGLAVVIVLASTVGILVMPGTYRKLHYMTPVSVLAPLPVGLAVLIQSGWTADSAQTWLALLAVMIGGPFLSHATIRAARIRDAGDWRPGARPAARTGPRGGGPGDG
jgi:multisubunit Na+/H+ antiporter MnhG subunit